MSQSYPAALRQNSDPATAEQAANYQAAPLWRKLPGIPLALTVVFLGFLLLPRVQANPNLVWTFCGVAAGLLAWELILWVRGASQQRLFQVEFVAVKSHYVQASVQFAIMLYWGWYAEVISVYGELPLIAAQVVFLYILEALFTWSRGRTWRMGFGPLPIILSTNLLLWFKDDVFYWQFVMITIGILGKQYLTWTRDGKKTHIFNPSAFGQAVVAVALIATATTKDLTWGREIASTFEVPHMLLVIFLGGLVVQALFQVTLMTLAAATVLLLTNLIYTWQTGVYFFVDVTIAAPIFLGIHLLITDPATSPRTNVGRVAFGALYALGYVILFRVLDMMGIPLFWDKLLPVPILNLCVPLIDRFARSGFVGRINQRWQEALPPAKLNLIHMGCWIALFVTMMSTGLIEAAHPGDSIPFWKKAIAEGKPYAGHSLVMAAGSLAEGQKQGAAYNELGLICMEGKIVPENHTTAALYFSRAVELGNTNGCINVAIQRLFLGEKMSDEIVTLAFDQLEQTCAAKQPQEPQDWRVCYLVGAAYETGRGRPLSLQRALEFYARCDANNMYAWKGIARIGLAGGLSPRFNFEKLAMTLEASCNAGDAESCWYAAYYAQRGLGAPPDDQRARTLLQHACDLKSKQACDALTQPQLPQYENPVMLAPGWSTAYPMP